MPTADFALVERIEDADRVDLPLPLFAKPVAEGTGKGITAASKILDRPSLGRSAPSCWPSIASRCWWRPSCSGREFTVGIAGTGPEAEVLGSMEVVLLPGAEAEVYSYVNKEKCEELCRYLPDQARRDEEVRQAEAVALAAYRALGCRDAGRVDFRCDGQGRPHFIEVNPLAGLHP